MTNKPPATEGLAAGLAEFVLVPRADLADLAEGRRAFANIWAAKLLAAAPSPASSGETGEPRAIANRMREIIQDVWDKKEGYTDRQAWSDLHGQAMRLLGWEIATRALATPEQKPGMVTVKPLVWREYSLPHDYGNGSWEANGVHGIYEILDVGGDPKNGLRYYLRGYSQFDTLDEAKAAAQADYTARILSAIEVTP